ncbi:hypothetical protein FGADI_9554 [Fusarium gaditjirri]|uniref:DUF4387 domain-containing protein n=1 Tax=Fusarium gaditjirri TaxID=282569 RepID=A0A8H4WSS1_9HYPO|nr:hypothetical protein FGADI_9554 [Fusarium gaditjirri]
MLLAQPEIELNTTDLNGHTPLTLALKKGFENTVNLLLDMENIDLGLDGHGRMPLSMAFESGQLTTASKILTAERRRNPSETSQTLLSWASQNDRRDVVRQINNLYTINPNLQDGDGDTPLSKAAERGNLSMVRLLLENSSVDVNAKNKDGSTPMSRAAMKQHKNVVQLLAAKDNVTLHSIIRAGNQQLTHYLLSCDIDLNLKDTHGLTALHIAIISRQLQIFEMLLLRGADIDAKDGTGRTPLILAAQYTLRDFVEILLSRSACMKGIQIRDWQRIYNCNSPESTLYVSERAGGVYQVRFIDTKRTLQHEPDITSFWLHGLVKLSHQTQASKHLTENLAAVAVAVWVPHIRMFTQGSGWDECGIAWTIGDIVEDLGLGEMTKDHVSMLPYGWIPQNGIDFFQQLILHLAARWSELCTGVEDHLSERRMKQLQEKGRSDIINDLAGDAKNLAELRRCLRTQVHEAKMFVDNYGRSQGVDVDGQAFKTIGGFAKIDNLLQELDQTIRDLLQLEFAWVSINEAHKSTSLATIYLPASYVYIKKNQVPARRTRRDELARIIRSKNSGPFKLAFDTTFGDKAVYNRVQEDNVLTNDVIKS